MRGLLLIVLLLASRADAPISLQTGSFASSRFSIFAFPDFAGSGDTSVFPYGVASGDPLDDALIIWTMIDAACVTVDEEVRWEVSADSTFTMSVRSGSVKLSEKHHYRVKVDVQGLYPNTFYYYRFKYRDQISPLGRGRTTPAAHASKDVKLAVVSCNAYEWGFFNGYEALAAHNDLHAIVHLGDYIYEYATGE